MNLSPVFAGSEAQIYNNFFLKNTRGDFGDWRWRSAKRGIGSLVVHVVRRCRRVHTHAVVRATSIAHTCASRTHCLIEIAQTVDYGFRSIYSDIYSLRRRLSALFSTKRTAPTLNQ